MKKLFELAETKGYKVHNNKRLVEDVLEQIERDIRIGDTISLEELLYCISEDDLERYLPEEDNWGHTYNSGGLES